jgi:Flp pilus assembly protein TadG
MRTNGTSGQAVVEFVLLFPLLILLVLVIAEFGLMFRAYLTVNHAAAEAARYAAVGNLPGGCPAVAASVEERAVDVSSGVLACNEVTVTYVSGATVVRGDSVAVHLAHPYALVTGLGGMISFVTGGTIPTTIDMNVCSEARVEWMPVPPASPTAGGC